MIEAETLRGLLEPGEHLLSIYMAIPTGERDQRAHEAKCRGLLDAGEAALERRGLGPAERETLLAPLRQYVGSNAFAEHRQPGLAIFARPGGPPHLQPLPRAPEEEGAYAGASFHIKPLLPLLAANRRFWILALSRRDVRLLSATPFGSIEVKLEALPEAEQAELDSRPAGEGETLEETRTALIVAEPRLVANAVKAALGEDDAPLILAADPSVAGHFRQEVQLRQMLPEGLHLNPFGLAEADLHAKAVELMRPELEAELETVLNQIAARLGTAEKTVAIRLEEIIAAGSEARLDAVVVASDESLWGHYADGVVHTHGRPGAEDEELLNQAAVTALRTGGRAFAVPRERLPRGVPAAATLRF